MPFTHLTERLEGKPVLAGLAALLVSACGPSGCSDAAQAFDDATLDTLYGQPLEPPAAALSVFHIGHSLVGRDMPVMLEQLAAAAGLPGAHRHHSQLGWGTTLKAHWEPDDEIAGFNVENEHPRFRPAQEALESGEYDALVVTEMVEIRDAIRYFDSGAYLARWAADARAGNPHIRIYLYETWHSLDDADGWLERLDHDIDHNWRERILYPAIAADAAQQPIHLIPAGQVLARFVRAVEARGGVDGLNGRADLFADEIHINEMGAYLVALTHYAVLYHRSPVGLPHELLRSDNSPAPAPGPDAARLMQEIVWEVVTSEPQTGVAQATAAE